MLAAQADQVMALGEWEEHWREDNLYFHLSYVNQFLASNIDKVLAGRTGVRFFFPLCGKAVDMKWLADKGHSVVGVEIAEKAIRQFFEDSKMAYSEEPVPAIPGAKLYKGKERNISLYQCDLFSFSSSIEGQFGAIWDRGSLVAINPGDREKYASLIVSVMAKDCRYLVDTLLYNPELYKGPPFFVPDEQLHSLFGKSCDLELLQSVGALTDTQEGWGMDSLTENVHPARLKSGQILIQIVGFSGFDHSRVKSLSQKNTSAFGMLAAQADQVMALGEWEEHWREDSLDFHLSYVNQLLASNIDKVLAGRTGVRFFFPLCGKAVDMKWLADKGHSVVGVEISEKAIRQFFEDSKMAYSEEPVPAIPGAKLYKGKERNISLYQCDLFSFSSSIEGQFGAIWDRGSLVAINPGDREKYASLIVSVMAKDCRYLVDTLLYNPELYKGPPFFVPDEQLHSLFGKSCDLELLQSVGALTDTQEGWGLDSLTENVHLITPKSS